jgi:predicted DNA-binding transcriptional regulator AlpA
MESLNNENTVLQARAKQEQHRVSLDALLDEYDVARITSLSVATVRRWRLLRQGPVYLKLGASVRYKPQSISEWIESRPSGGGGLGAELKSA